MKYIRTKDGVYERHKCILNGWNFVFDTKIKEVDNLVELCDRFVITFNDKSLEPKQFKIFEAAFNFLKECDVKYNPELKGAIWTSKGLIYVAKIDDDGELELL